MITAKGLEGNGTTFYTFAHSVGTVLGSVIVPLLFAIAFIAFLWGVLNYFFLNADNEDKRREGRQFLLWGILGMVLLFALWGVVNILLETLGFAS